MKIGKVVKASEVPDVPRKRRGKYLAVWDRVALLKDGEFLPVEFETPRIARTFQASLASRRGAVRMTSRVRGNIVYIGKKTRP